MRIVFVTTLSLSGSTNRGRIIPLAQQLSRHHNVHLLTLRSHTSDSSSCPTGLSCHIVGTEPFYRHQNGKKRLKNISLFVNMLATAWHIFRTLTHLRPDCVIVSKPLPHNTLGVLLWHWFSRLHTSIILDVDDFELSANQLSSWLQRASIHWSERMATSLSNQIIAATPFLVDHFQFLKPSASVHLIPTGINPVSLPLHQTSHSSQPIITYLGSLSRSSGHPIELLPAIMKELVTFQPSAQLLIAGSGDDESFLRQKIQELHLSKQVIWYGAFTPNNLSDILTRTTIIIDPINNSVTERAKSSFRSVLAIVTGKPLVTSNIGIRADIVPPSFHDRFFAEPNNVHAYAKVINHLITNPLSTSESSTLIAYGQKYTWPILANSYNSIINHAS